MRSDQFTLPIAVFTSAVILAGSVVVHGIAVRPARYTFHFDNTPFRVWRGDTWTGDAVLSKTDPDGVIRERQFLP
jgi:hypothetical protein